MIAMAGGVVYNMAIIVITGVHEHENDFVKYFDGGSIMLMA